MIADDLIDADALAAGLAGLRVLLDADERRAVARVETVEPGFVRIVFADGEAWDFASGHTNPFLAESVFMSAAARAGRLDVQRH